MCNRRSSPPYLYQSPAGSFVSSSSKKSVAAVIFHTYDSSLSQLIKPTTTVLFIECTVINMGDWTTQNRADKSQFINGGAGCAYWSADLFCKTQTKIREPE